MRGVREGLKIGKSKSIMRIFSVVEKVTELFLMMILS